MKFETLKKNQIKKVVIGMIAIVAIAMVGIFSTSRAKYRNTQSIPLVRGIITGTSFDLNVIAVNLENAKGEWEPSSSVPTAGYTLNENLSKCLINGEEDSSIEIAYVNKKVNFIGVTKKGTKCNLYFDRDKEAPVVNDFTASATSSTIAITVDAGDNIGIANYYYVINGGAPVEKTTNSHTFTGLTAGQSYEITVYVSDGTTESEKLTKTVTALPPSEATLAKLGATISSGTPNFSKISYSSCTYTSSCENAVGIYATTDEAEKTSYYYRGDVTNNYLKFAGFWWRIIRINGDGTIRIIYDGTEYHANGTNSSNKSAVQNVRFNNSTNHNAYVGFMYGSTASDATYAETHTNINKSNALIELEKWYTSNLSDYENYIDKAAGFCGDRISCVKVSNGSCPLGGGYSTIETRYGWGNTHTTPSLSCNSNDFYTLKIDKGGTQGKGNNALDYPIGLITTDEMVMAGGGNSGNIYYYLYNNSIYWTMSPGSYNRGSSSLYVLDSGLSLSSVAGSEDLRPVINLRADLIITGTGVQGDEYEVSLPS